MHDRLRPRNLYPDLKFANEVEPDSVDWLWPDARDPSVPKSLDPNVRITKAII